VFLESTFLFTGFFGVPIAMNFLVKLFSIIT
jgi:hypothetical protein